MGDMVCVFVVIKARLAFDHRVCSCVCPSFRSFGKEQEREERVVRRKRSLFIIIRRRCCLRLAHSACCIRPPSWRRCGRTSLGIWSSEQRSRVDLGLCCCCVWTRARRPGCGGPGWAVACSAGTFCRKSCELTPLYCAAVSANSCWLVCSSVGWRERVGQLAEHRRRDAFEPSHGLRGPVPRRRPTAAVPGPAGPRPTGQCRHP